MLYYINTWEWDKWGTVQVIASVVKFNKTNSKGKLKAWTSDDEIVHIMFHEVESMSMNTKYICVRGLDRCDYLIY